jgi:tetratricopeptide (TPR) repeat protein
VSPGDSIAMCRMASSKYAQGKYDEAMALLREQIKQKPNSYCAYFTLGVSFADAGLYRDAIRQWRKVVEIAPDSPEAVSAKESIDVLEKFLQGK